MFHKMLPSLCISCLRNLSLTEQNSKCIFFALSVNSVYSITLTMSDCKHKIENYTS